jgi:DNA-binding NarL/FixJ family response regulator
MNQKKAIIHSRFPLVTEWLMNSLLKIGWEMEENRNSLDRSCVRIVEIADISDTKTLEIQVRYGAPVVIFSRLPVTKLLGLLFDYEISGVIHFASDNRSIKEVMDAASRYEEYYDETILTFILSNKYREIHERIAAISNREMEIIEGIMADLTNDEIAEKFDLSVRTVNAHKRNILQKMGERSLVGVVRTMLTYTLHFD